MTTLPSCWEEEMEIIFLKSFHATQLTPCVYPANLPFQRSLQVAPDTSEYHTLQNAIADSNLIRTVAFHLQTVYFSYRLTERI